jgi:hypothetical protein
MIDAGQKDFTLALEAGEIDSNRVAIITVNIDGAWSKRSYKTNYNGVWGSFYNNWCSIKKKVLYIKLSQVAKNHSSFATAFFQCF